MLQTGVGLSLSISCLPSSYTFHEGVVQNVQVRCFSGFIDDLIGNENVHARKGGGDWTHNDEKKEAVCRNLLEKLYMQGRKEIIGHG